MTEYKLDLSFNREGTVNIRVFNLDDGESAPVDTCEVGTGLDAEELRRAWEQFQTRGMSDKEKALVLDLWDRDELSDTAARELLGDAAFEDTREKAWGAEQMLSGDTSRFLTEEE